MSGFIKAKTGFEGDNYELNDELLDYAIQDDFTYRNVLTNTPQPL